MKDFLSVCFLFFGIIPIVIWDKLSGNQAPEWSVYACPIISALVAGSVGFCFYGILGAVCGLVLLLAAGALAYTKYCS